MAFGNLLAVVFNKTATATSSTPSPSTAPRIRNDRQLRSLKRASGAGSRFHRVPHCLPKSPVPLKPCLLCSPGGGLRAAGCLQRGAGGRSCWAGRRRSVLRCLPHAAGLCKPGTCSRWMQLVAWAGNVVYPQPSLKCLRIISVNHGFSQAQWAKLTGSRCSADLEKSSTFRPCICCHEHQAKASGPSEEPTAIPL